MGRAQYILLTIFLFASSIAYKRLWKPLTVVNGTWDCNVDGGDFGPIGYGRNNPLLKSCVARVTINYQLFTGYTVDNNSTNYINFNGAHDGKWTGTTLWYPNTAAEESSIFYLQFIESCVILRIFLMCRF